MRVLFTFGLNEDGQCGYDESLENNKKFIESVEKFSDESIKREIFSPRAVRFPNTSIIVVKISAGSRHTLALTSNGEVYSWGWGHLGQLGHGNSSNLYSPHRIGILHDITSISAGGMHSGCIDKNHYCYTWGASGYGQLGLGTMAVKKTCFTVPEIVKYTNNIDNESDEKNPLLVSVISCGGMHTGVIDIDGYVYCWGKADSGQTGSSDWYLNFFPGVAYPRKVLGFEGKAVNISCGGFHTLILTDSNSVYVMGKEDFGLLGTGNSVENSMSIGAESPTLVQALKEEKIIGFSSGGWHSCFLTENGQLYVCGKGEYGRLGVGDEKSKTLPTPIGHNHSIVNVSAGGSHTIFTNTIGEIYTVGRLDGGRCGVGILSSDRIKTPTKINDNFYKSNMHIISLSAGGSHTTVLVDYPDITNNDFDRYFR